MIHADWILTNAIVLTMDDEFNLYEPGAVVVSGDSILAVGRQEEIQNAYNVTFSFGYIVSYLLIGLGTVLLSVIVPLLYILRLNPKKIMM